MIPEDSSKEDGERLGEMASGTTFRWEKGVVGKDGTRTFDVSLPKVGETWATVRPFGGWIRAQRICYLFQKKSLSVSLEKLS